MGSVASGRSGGGTGGGPLCMRRERACPGGGSGRQSGVLVQRFQRATRGAWYHKVTPGARLCLRHRVECPLPRVLSLDIAVAVAALPYKHAQVLSE